MNISILTTADGSPTLYREDLDEHYHSIKGATAESLHVYVELGWKAAPDVTGTQRVFEVGFGTGLNAALTALEAARLKMPTEYYAVELHPLATDITLSLAEFLPQEHKEMFLAVNDAGWNRTVEINPFFHLHKIHGSLLDIALPGELDTVYFDAFAPEKQPDMWDSAVFRKIYGAMRPGAVLTTYCAKGAIRRLMQDVGFLTERLPGPPGGKREVLRARRPLSR